jgi:serine/threonine protein kinase
MGVQVIERDQLGELARIGQGGQGVVYGAPKVRTKFAASMVYKEYKAAVLAGIDFSALAAMPALVEDTLSYQQAERLISLAAWPCALVHDGDVPRGFVMPVIPEAFFTELTTVKGVSSTPAEFQHLLNHSSVLAARGITIDDVQRYTLLREAASALAFLHKHGVCVGDISPKNLLYTLTPQQAIYFIDCDAMRINDVSALTQVETPGWGVPSGEELATIYSDTYKLGLLALRLLAGDHDTTNTAHLPPTTPALLRQLITDTVTNDAQRRPLPQAWTYVLGHAIEEAQHRQKTAAPATPATAPTAPAVPIVRSRPPVDATPSTPPTAHAVPPSPTDPTQLVQGMWAEIITVGDDHHQQIGRIIDICDDDDGRYVIVQFADNLDKCAFRPEELIPVAPPAERLASTTAVRSFPPTVGSKPPVGPLAPPRRTVSPMQRALLWAAGVLCTVAIVIAVLIVINVGDRQTQQQHTIPDVNQSVAAPNGGLPPAPATITPPPPPATTTPAGARQVTYSVTGTKAPGDIITVTYVDASGRSRTQRNVVIPWSLTVTPISNSDVGSVQASSLSLTSRLNCSITTSDGTVLSSNTNNAAQTSC